MVQSHQFGLQQFHTWNHQYCLSSNQRCLVDLGFCCALCLREFENFMIFVLNVSHLHLSGPG